MNILAFRKFRNYLAHLYTYEKRIHIIDNHGQYKKNIRLTSIVFENEIINSLIRFHAFTGNDYVSSFCRKEKAACFKILQGSSKFQSTFATLGNDLNISDDLLTKLEGFVCHICGMRKKDANEVWFVKYYSKYQN